MSSHPLFNVPAPDVPYFTPRQDPPAGAALAKQPDGKAIPTLFRPLQVRGVEFHNRIWLFPLSQYSANNGMVTPWHMAHLGGIISRGPGLTMVESAAVTPEGRVTPETLGIWSDEQACALSGIVTFAHSQNQKIGIQLVHGGRKASTVAPWLSFGGTATENVGGWPNDVLAPSAIAHSPALPMPMELTKEGIERIKQAFVHSAKRAAALGFDVIEIHGGHGFLLHEFMSPVSNHRTDEYGGTFENRTRLPLEIIDAVRLVIPQGMPLLYRLSASDRLENASPSQPSWTIHDSVRLAKLLSEHGVDILDVSSAGNHPQQELPPRGKNAVHADLSGTIKAAVGDDLVVTTVGGITSGDIAQSVLDNNGADVVFVGRQFLKNPGTVLQFAEDLGVLTHSAHQMWAFGFTVGRGVGGAQISSGRAKQ